MSHAHNSQTGNTRHLWIMIVCCLIPVIALTTIFLLRIPVAPVIAISLLLMCPLGPLLMIRLGNRSHDG